MAKARPVPEFSIVTVSLHLFPSCWIGDAVIFIFAAGSLVRSVKSAFSSPLELNQ